jgi:3(or 17)beta-hydroxysteroid dehydrogenase
MNRLDGKVALISGAARGIGAETARLMIEAGAKVAIGDVLDERGRETARALGDNALYHHLDVTREGRLERRDRRDVARFGGIDILVNNAGMFLGKGIEEASLDEWHRLAGINLTGVFLGTKLALPALRERGKESAAWQRDRQPRLGRGAGRLAARPALFDDQGRGDAVHQIAALEFARKGYRIRVNSIHPGVIQTDMGEQTFTARARNLGTNDVDDARRMALSTHPIGRLGVPNDIAKGIVFLASDDAGFMTGAGLVVDGGPDGAVAASFACSNFHQASSVQATDQA